MKHLLWVIGLIALIVASVFFYYYTGSSEGEGRGYLIGLGVCFGIAAILFAIFFFLRFREEGEQDISITKF